MSYYNFFGPSLPALSLTAPPPLSLADFRRACAVHLSAPDQAALAAVLGEGSGHADVHPFVFQWRAFEARLDNAIVRAHAARQHRDPGPLYRPAHGADALMEQRVAEAFTHANPLARELALDRVRWHAAGELAGLNAFGTGAILAYAVKLRLAERWARLAPEAGTAGSDGAHLHLTGDFHDRL